MSDPKAKPEVHGELLNPAFFAHPAYVMQGVSDRDELFALPLQGVPELSFYPILGDLPASSLTWMFEVSHPEGIGAAIEEGTLYIWGSSPQWQGYGEAHLHVGAPDGRTSWVTIPVVVFGSDRTLVNPQGKKDYFVPWGVVLDINRILSVEEHMRQYSKPDLGLLDRTLRFSRWRPMELMRAVHVGSRWLNDKISGGSWPLSTQLALVDVALKELLHPGFDTIWVYNEHYVGDHSDPVIRPLYDVPNIAGPTKTEDEESYVVAEAHRLGLRVLAGNLVNIGRPGLWQEIFYAYPDPLDGFLANLTALELASLRKWCAWGVEYVDLFRGITSIHETHHTYSQARALNDGLIRLIAEGRNLYPGPFFDAASHYDKFFPGESIFDAPFWSYLDIIGITGWAVDLTGGPTDSLDALITGWKRLIREVMQPLQQKHNKPFLMGYDVGAFAVRGCANYGVWCPWQASFDPSLQNLSLEDMRLYYLAHWHALRQMEGYYGTPWDEYPIAPWPPGGIRDTANWTFRLKIEDTIQEINLGYVVPRVVSIDGVFDDWDEAYVVLPDPLGDASGPNDIVRVSHVQDTDYFFFLVEYSSPPASLSNLDLLFDVSGNRRADLILRLSNQFSPHKDWSARGSLSPDDGSRIWKIVGVSDNIDSGNRIEIRLAKRFLEPYLRGPVFHVKVAHLSSDWRMHDETQWFPVSVEGQ